MSMTTSNNTPDILWLSIASYGDSNHTVIREIYLHKQNAYNPPVLVDRSTKQECKPIKNEVWELNFLKNELVFVSCECMPAI